jgi:hypothetical protein
MMRSELATRTPVKESRGAETLTISMSHRTEPLTVRQK